jgi:hypothetical protein
MGNMIRPQYHLRPSSNGCLAWSVGRLIELSDGLPIQPVDLSTILELDENHWFAFERQVPTVRSILRHLQLIDEADLAFPIILVADGRLMDGVHRVCKAIRQGDTQINARRFRETPSPDFVGRALSDLPYE